MGTVETLRKSPPPTTSANLARCGKSQGWKLRLHADLRPSVDIPRDRKSGKDRLFGQGKRRPCAWENAPFPCDNDGLPDACGHFQRMVEVRWGTWKIQESSNTTSAHMQSNIDLATWSPGSEWIFIDTGYLTDTNTPMPQLAQCTGSTKSLALPYICAKLELSPPMKTTLPVC